MILQIHDLIQLDFFFFFLKIGVLQQQLDFILEAFLHLAALRDSMINNRR